MPPKPALPAEILELKNKLDQAKLPEELRHRAYRDLRRLLRLFKVHREAEEYNRVSHWIDWLTSLPWQKFAPTNIDLDHVKIILDQNHHGLEKLKARILEYLAILKLNQNNPQKARSTNLLITGLVGTGKTSFAASIAQAIDRPFARIPFGGLGSARDLRGQSRLHLEAEPGHITKAIKKAGVNNPIILLDELDRVVVSARSDVMGVLVELLDPDQNHQFLDHYLDYPLDLSQVIFIATANNTQNIATAVLDRLEIISMPSYTDQEKIAIAKNHLLPQIINRAGLKPQQIIIDDQLWPQIVRPLGYDAGIRTLGRSLQKIVRRFALEHVQKNTPALHLTTQNISHYLPKV
jgi:ATP-dependent Lon protease